MIGPAFHNTDLSISKALTIAGRYRVQLRADAFDLFNHPNFGPPGNVVGSPTFGKISRTRLPTGEAGSSRQIQLVGEAVVLMRRPRRCALFLAAAILAALAQTAVRAQPVTKHVLIIHGGPEAFPGNDVFDAALREVLFSHPTIQVDAHSEYLENEEFAETADAALLEYIRIKFAGRRPDLVIANTAPALTFVLRHRDELFPNVPVVFVSASEPDGLRAGTLRGVTGVLRLPSQVETVDLALKLHPSTRRLHVVAYAPEVDGFQERVASAMAVYSPRLTVSFTNEPTLPQALAVLKALPKDSLILWVRYSPVTKNRVIFPGEFLPEIAAVAPVPIYAALGFLPGQRRGRRHDAHQH